MKHEIGTRVIMVGATDETADTSAMGKHGRVYEHNCNQLTGNTAEDPLHEVAFDDNTYGTFWYEELKAE